MSSFKFGSLKTDLKYFIITLSSHTHTHTNKISLSKLRMVLRLREIFYLIRQASLIAQLVKNPPEMQETLARFLGQEDPLEKG